MRQNLKIMKHIYTLLFLLVVSLSFGQLKPPATLEAYYEDVNFSATGTNLYKALATTTIAKHTNFLSYSQRHDYLYNADQDPSNSNNVILIYSGESKDKREYQSANNTYNPQTFNTEHVYPKSFLNNTTPEGDLHHLRACKISVNSDRGNKPFTDGSGTYGLKSSSWYPGDDWRGDVARMLMYINLRYNEPFSDVGSLNLFLEWNAQDPVSAIEDQRNTVISNAQGNRNPFIDNPYLATIIWGGTAAQNRWEGVMSLIKFSDSNITILPNPAFGNTIAVTTSDVLQYKIYDVLGKVIDKGQTKNQTISIQGLTAGIYILKLSNGSQQLTKKLIRK